MSGVASTTNANSSSIANGNNSLENKTRNPVRGTTNSITNKNSNQNFKTVNSKEISGINSPVSTNAPDS
jgi:hypothetical protein